MFIDSKISIIPPHYPVIQENKNKYYQLEYDFYFHHILNNLSNQFLLYMHYNLPFYENYLIILNGLNLLKNQE